MVTLSGPPLTRPSLDYLEWTPDEGPLWSILVTTLASRRDKLERMLNCLMPQILQSGANVEVVGLHNNGEWPLADLQQYALKSARGEYVSFVDDDDLVEPDFVEAVVGAMWSKPDFVAFHHAFYSGVHRESRPVVTGIGYNGWYDTADALIRDVTHINPVRRDLAWQCDFRHLEAGEGDRGYVAKLRTLLKTEARIDRVMYHYYWDPADSYCITHQARRSDLPRLDAENMWTAFRWLDWSPTCTPL